MVPVRSPTSDLFQRSVTYRFDQEGPISTQSFLELFQGMPGVDVARDIDTVRVVNKNVFEVTFNSFAKKQEATIKLRSEFEQIHVTGYGLGTMVTCLNVPAYLDEGVLQATLSRYGKISAAKCPTYPPPFDKIKKGVRQYRMELEKNIPNGIRIGNAIIWVRYMGQKQVCNKCGEEDHFFAQCPYKKCNKCLEFGHIASECQGEIKCTVCGEVGHIFKSCPKSYANVIVPTENWAKRKDEKENEESTHRNDESTSQSQSGQREEGDEVVVNVKIPVGIEDEEVYIQCLSCNSEYAVNIKELSECSTCGKEVRTDECKMQVCDGCASDEKMICLPCYNSIVVKDDDKSKKSTDYSIESCTSSSQEGKVEEQTQQSVQIETPESSSVEETQVKKPIPARRSGRIPVLEAKKSQDKCTLSYSPLKMAASCSSQASEQKSVSQAEKEGDRENEDMEWKIHSNKRSRPATDSSEDATPQSQKKKVDKTVLINKAKEKLSRSKLVKNDVAMKCDEKPCSLRAFQCVFKKFVNHNKVHHQCKPIALRCVSPSCSHLSKSPSEWASHVCLQHPEEVLRKSLQELESWFI
ncbi:uncharacterized protein LOC144923795 [Branchiostoma floridae x Branchiostoma belcheri]